MAVRLKRVCHPSRIMARCFSKCVLVRGSKNDGTRQPDIAEGDAVGDGRRDGGRERSSSGQKSRSSTPIRWPRGVAVDHGSPQEPESAWGPDLYGARLMVTRRRLGIDADNKISPAVNPNR